MLKLFILQLLFLMNRYEYLSLLPENQYPKLPEKTENVLRIMTFNVRYKNTTEDEEEHWWEKRVPLIVQMIKYYKPDIIGLQEPYGSQVLDIYNPFKNIYNWFGKPRSDYDKKNKLEFNQYNPIFYDKKRLTLKEYDTFWLNETGKKYKPGWSLIKPRICTWGLFTFKDSKEFYIFNTHLPEKSIPEKPADLESRKKTAQLLIEKIFNITNNEKLFFLMGDFNLNLTKKATKNLFFKHDEIVFYNSEDLLKGIKPVGPYGTYTGWKIRPGTKLDFIFTNKKKPKEISIKRYEVIERKDHKFLSDHRPLVIDVEIK